MSPKKSRTIARQKTRSGKTSLKKRMKEVQNGVRKNVCDLIEPIAAENIPLPGNFLDESTSREPNSSTNDILIDNTDFGTLIQFTSTPLPLNVNDECNQPLDAVHDLKSYTLPSEIGSSNTEILTDHISGRRIVDIEYVFKQIQNNVHGGGLDCSFMNMSFVSEKRYGFFSKFKFKCKICNIVTVILSEPKNDLDKSYLPINKAVTNGTVAIGIGQKQLSELSAAMEIPCMANSTFFKEQEILSTSIHNLAWEEIKKAGEEERKLAMEAGDVDGDGIPFCTVVADGQWSKRSYKTKYDALSGVATIIGYKTKKVLFVGIRNRFCIICSRAETKKETPNSHKCFLNWEKSATGMEADGVAEGFLKSIELHNLKFNKLIGDGDSSVTKRLKEIKPYGPNFLLQKIECRNHMLRNYIQKLTFIARKTHYPIRLRKFILRNILRFRTAIVTAIKHRKNENIPTTQKIKNLSTDLKNSPYHILGEHSNCDNYFCKKRNLEEENWVQRAEICGMMVEINNTVNRLVLNSESLILDVDNNICEQFNSIINKYIGGKRVNFSQRNSYNTRVEAAVVAFNSKKYLRAINKNVIKKSPGKFSKLFLKDIERKRSNNKRRRQLFPSKISNKTQKSGPDENYGLADELVDDLTSADYESRKHNFLNLLKNTDREQLENETRDQAKSQLWCSERRKRITASNIGKICKMRQYTSCKKTVHDLLYGNINYKIKAIEYGRIMENEAKTQFENKYGHKIKPVGLYVDENIPYLAASPDGLIGEFSTIEIKCPFSARNCSDIFDAINAGKIPFCHINEDNNVVLKTNHNYYYQIQTQLHVTKRKTCYFFTYTENWNYSLCITYDENFWYQKVQSQIQSFYYECLLPELINPQFGKRLLVTDIIDPPRILKEQATKKK